MTAVVLTMNDVHRDMQAVHDWLRAHDLEPNDTIPGVVVRGDEVTATVWLRDADGNRRMVKDPHTGHPICAAHEIVTVPLRQPVPDGLGTEFP